MLDRILSTRSMSHLWFAVKWVQFSQLFILLIKGSIEDCIDEKGIGQN